jgi:aspartate 4-decarboxylase
VKIGRSVRKLRDEYLARYQESGGKTQKPKKK